MLCLDWADVGVALTLTTKISHWSGSVDVDLEDLQQMDRQHLPEWLDSLNFLDQYE